jgi:phospholipase C
MATHPMQQEAVRTFAQNAPGAEPESVPTGSFRLALSYQGKALGWLGQDRNQWAVLVDEHAHSLVLQAYFYNDVNYFRIKGSSRYMSVSTGSYIGFYDWIGATGFTLKGARLVSDSNGQCLSLHSKEDGFLFAWDKYMNLDVTLEPVAKPVIPNQPLTSLIEHVVVVMLENRSFDNMLGGLYRDKTRQGLYRGLTGEESNPLDPADPSKGRASVFEGDPGNPATAIMPYPDPGELFVDMNAQLFGSANPAPGSLASMQGFAWNYSKQPGAPLTKDGALQVPGARDAMHYYAEQSVPMTSFLARQYAVCDGWFASGPVQTLSNRMFAQCGTPGRIPGTNQARVNNPDFIKGMTAANFSPPVKDKTIFQLLDETYPGETNWKVYYHDAPVAALSSYVFDHWKMASTDGGNVFSFKEWGKAETNFEYDIKHHRLPKYAFIEPRYTNFYGDGPVNSSHPGGAGIDFKDPNGSSLPPAISVTDGEAFLKQVYQILSAYPETFKKTLLIVTYDEHGGIYDHVAPPAAVSPFAEPVDNFSYDRYGVRVPALFINPAIAPGTIYPPRSEVGTTFFDHTSLISTVCAQFGLPGSLTPRSAAAPVLKNLIGSADAVVPRPAPPEFGQAVGAMAEHVPPVPPVLDLAQALSVLDQQDHPHSLAHALLPLYKYSALHKVNNAL